MDKMIRQYFSFFCILLQLFMDVGYCISTTGKSQYLAPQSGHEKHEHIETIPFIFLPISENISEDKLEKLIKKWVDPHLKKLPKNPRILLSLPNQSLPDDFPGPDHLISKDAINQTINKIRDRSTNVDLFEEHQDITMLKIYGLMKEVESPLRIQSVGGFIYTVICFCFYPSFTEIPLWMGYVASVFGSFYINKLEVPSTSRLTAYFTVPLLYFAFFKVLHFIPWPIVVGGLAFLGGFIYNSLYKVRKDSKEYISLVKKDHLSIIPEYENIDLVIYLDAYGVEEVIHIQKNFKDIDQSCAKAA